MACLCDHTMQKVNDGNPKVFWCPRCGTLKTEGCVPEFEAPAIVKRLIDCLPRAGKPRSGAYYV